LPGSSTAELVLNVAPRDGAPALANEPLFAQWRANLPKPWAEGERANFHWSSNGEREILEFAIPDATSVEFFPRASDFVQLKHQRFDRDGNGGRLELEWKLEPPKASPRPETVFVEGVARVHGAKGARAFDLSLPIPSR
jgi:hypothetical protein